MTKRWTATPATARPGATGATTTSSAASTCSPPRRSSRACARSRPAISFCLSLPLDFPGGTALNQRRHPPRRRADRGHGGHRRHLLQRPHERDARLRRPQVRRRVGRRRGDPLAAVLDAVGLARPRRRRVRRRRRRRRGGRLLQRLPRRRRPRRPERRRPGRRQRARLLRAPPRPGAHGVPRRAGPRRARRPRPPPRPRLAGRRPGRRSRRSWRPTTSSSSPATCSCCTPASPPRSSSGTRTPTRWRSHRCAPTSTPTTAAARVDRRVADLGARRRQLRGRGAARQGPRPEPALVPPDPPPLPVQARRPARRAVVPARAGGLAARARPQPVPAHRAAAAPPGDRGLPADARRDRAERRAGSSCRRADRGRSP